MRRVIIGTAGHIDHGKTSLVKAMTGIDADRLKEEKERGITIDIGFADLTIGDTHFGIVDVPGHERFVKNMLAGAHGIDLVMLVVAADEGVMPQTREHFEICRMLAVKTGLIAVTKIDMVEPDFLELVISDVADYCRGSFLEGAPILPVSSRTGEGIDELKKTISKLAAKVELRDETAVARLPIDRVFTIRGFGTVVTGTLIAGRIEVGDELELLPSDRRRARVRGLQVHGRAAKEARAGERTAINLQGVEISEISRGQILAPAGRLQAGPLLDVNLELIDSAPRPLKTRARVRLHLGTAEVLARVVLPGRTELAPGSTAFAQLRLETTAAALPGDRFIIRSYSPSMTIGGGAVIDPHPQKHRARDSARRIELLEKLSSADEIERIALFIEAAGERGMSHEALAARTGSTDETIRRAAESLTKSRRAVAASNSPLLLISKEASEGLARGVRELLKDFHRRLPLESGMAREEVRERLFDGLHPDIFRSIVSALSERNEIVADKDLLRLASHRVALSETEQAALDHLASSFVQAALQPVSLDEAVSDAAASFDIDLPRMQRFAQMLVNSGDLVKVADLVFHKSALENVRDILRSYKAEHGPRIDVGVFKDLTGVSRKYAIPLLEYMDRQRVTRRVGDAREIM